MPISLLLSIFLCVGFPFLARYGERSRKFPSWLSSIVACYLIGILVRNFHLWPIEQKDMELIAGISMFIGLPLLLLAVRIKESLGYAGQMLFSFFLCCLSGLVCTAIAGYYYYDQFPEAWKAAGMLVGLYTGGTPNVLAIGVALEAPTNYAVLIQAADILLGGSILLGLVSFLPAVYGRFFRPSETGPGEEHNKLTERIAFKKQIPQLMVGLLITAISIGLCFLLTGGITDMAAIILLLTTISLSFSAIPATRRLGNTYPLGEYFILVFCVAVGLAADFRELAEKGLDLLYFSALALIATTLLHLILSKLFDLDRDTVILSYVAALYGPIFVVQVAAALKNQRLLAAGIAVSLLGFGIGNYLGVGLAYFVAWLGGG